MDYTIYVITNEVNGKEYVGVTSDLRGRWSSHKTAARKGHDTHLYNAMRKHGVDQFSIQPVEHVEAREQAFDVEKQWIADLDTFHGRGYNQTTGGDAPPLLTGEDAPLYGVTGEDHPTHGMTGKDSPAYGRNDMSGEDNPAAKLTSDEASHVKWYSLNSSLSQREIGSIFGVSKTMVRYIKFGENWPNATPNPPADNGQLRLPLGAT